MILKKDQYRWRKYLSEFIGTGILVLLGLSLVIFMFGENSSSMQIIPDFKLRQLITGFLFGSIGASIALSPIGKVSGAHINPVITLGFRLMGKIDVATAVGYIIAQLTGAIAGSLPLLIWGKMGQSVAYGATLPGIGCKTLTVVMGEVGTTFVLVVGLCLFLGFRNIRPYTPAIIPVLYAIMIPLEASISGTSTNPARTIGPAVISGQWEGWWIYWVGPLLGMLLGILACSFMVKRIEVAKIYHFESDNRKFFKSVNK